MPVPRDFAAGRPRRRACLRARRGVSMARDAGSASSSGSARDPGVCARDRPRHDAWRTVPSTVHRGTPSWHATHFPKTSSLRKRVVCLRWMVYSFI